MKRHISGLEGNPLGEDTHEDPLMGNGEEEQADKKDNTTEESEEGNLFF